MAIDLFLTSPLQVPVSLYQLGRLSGVLGSSCVYWLKRADDDSLLGHVRPKLVMKGNTLVLKFM